MELMKKILCLSGGGVRGVAQLQVLKKLEEEYGKPLYQVYDLIIGTSVGAINAAIISTGKLSMDELDSKYDSMIHTIFKKRGLFKTPKYDRDNFIKVWSENIGYYQYGQAKTKLMVTTVDLVTDTNIFYKSWHDEFVNKLHQMPHIVERSFAAPVYFGQIVDTLNRKVYSDGGIGNANLPLNEAKLQAESFGWYRDGEEVEIHAIGTLFESDRPSFEKVAHGRWLIQILDYLSIKKGGLARAQSRMDQIRMMEYICEHTSSIKFKYWDMGVDNKYIILDGVNYIDNYRIFGKEMAQEPLFTFN